VDTVVGLVTMGDALGGFAGATPESRTVIAGSLASEAAGVAGVSCATGGGTTLELVTGCGAGLGASVASGAATGAVEFGVATEFVFRRP